MPVLHLDRSRIVSRQECAMLRYLNYHWGGKGIAPETKSLPLQVGIAIHVGIEQIWKTESIEQGVNAAAAVFMEGQDKDKLASDPEALHTYIEQWALVEGLLRGWHKVRYPLLREDYEVVDVEREVVVELAPGIRLMLRFDVVLRRKDDGLLVVLDYKTLSYLNDEWQKQHEVSLQTLLYTWAASQIYGESVGIQYEGLLKGMRRTDTAKSSPWYGKKVQQSAFCYGYHMENVGLWQSEWTSAKGWTKIFVPKHHTSAQWVELLEQEGKLSNLFPIIPVVLPTFDDQQAAVESVVYEETHFAARLNDLQHEQLHGKERKQLERKLFEQNRGRCYKYGIGNACPMLEYCYNSMTREDPLNNGFVERTPHHEGETDG